ncbi:MAG: hypothetical protein K2I92_01045 [Muribaculaceae bacterium]|nr:hypothetical protein [Muribaculaceae bacterium]
MNTTKSALCAIAAFALAFCAQANDKVGVGNPYLPLWEHLPDGEPRVFEDPDNPGKYRAYIIGSHDLRVNEYCGPDIRMWSAPVEDLTDWRDEGAIFTYQKDGKWDVMFAPDLVEVRDRKGNKEYYLYPHSRGPRREAMVCKGPRPDGPFTPVNLNADGSAVVEGSILGFDPSIYVEQITDKKDPDYKKGFRAYGFWGFQHSSAAELDQNTMYSVRPGTEIIPYFMPASSSYGNIKDPAGTEYPALYSEQNPGDFNFFEASSIRKVGNKYVMIFSGYSGPDYGLPSTNSTLRYAFADSPLGPWRSGGVLVDSRGIELNEDGTALKETNAAHNTHGSLQEINGQWYVFYHRPPRGFGFARQAMVAPVKIEWDQKKVADGGIVTITGYDPYAPDEKWTVSASNGDVYPGAEVTSEGFQIYGLDPYKYYDAGYACYLSNIGSMQDTWDIWNPNMKVEMKGGDIVGYKYFGFGGLDKPLKGLQPFEGTKPGNGTQFHVSLTPQAPWPVTIDVMLDGPYENSVWKGKKIGEIQVPGGMPREKAYFNIDVSETVDNLDGKHAIYLVAKGIPGRPAFDLNGIGFGKKGDPLLPPSELPQVEIFVNGVGIDLPEYPTRSNDTNGYTGYDRYDVPIKLSTDKAPEIAAGAVSNAKDVKIEIKQPKTAKDKGVVRFDYKGKVKTYTLIPQ